MGWHCISELRPLMSLPRWYMNMESHGEWYYWETEELWEKPVPVSLCPPQILRGLTQTSTVRGWWLTAWATAWLAEHLALLRIQRSPRFKSWMSDIQLRFLVLFLSLQANVRIVPQSRPWLLRSMSFPTECHGWVVNTPASYAGVLGSNLSLEIS
jgi:hypothetical protein